MLAANALEEALLWCDTQNLLHGRRLDERILRVLELVDEKLPGPVDMENLAATVALSESRLSHLFRQQVGVPPRRYVERQRMLAAAHMLEMTQRPVGSIAGAVGFDDPFYFSNRFRAVMGTSPSAYRAGLRSSGS
jgi:AraC family transcriptional regulator of arabinose operon